MLGSRILTVALGEPLCIPRTDEVALTWEFASAAAVLGSGDLPCV